MEIQFGFWPQTFFMVLARVAGLTATVPFYGGPRVQPVIRVALALAMAVVLTPHVPAEWAAAAASLNTGPSIVFGMLAEVLLGAGVGMICNVAIAACALAGTLVAEGAGLLASQEVDPLTEISNPAIGTVFSLSFTVLVVVSNAHLVLLKLVAGSFHTVPPRLAWLDGATLQGLLSLGSTMFLLGLKLAAPLVAASMILNVAMALIARLASDFDILFLSLPVRLFVGLSVTGLILRFGAGVFGQVIDWMLVACAELLG